MLQLPYRIFMALNKFLCHLFISDPAGLQIYKNLTGSGWALSNENRTLTLNKDYDLDGSHYRCQVITRFFSTVFSTLCNIDIL